MLGLGTWLGCLAQKDRCEGVGQVMGIYPRGVWSVRSGLELGLTLGRGYRPVHAKLRVRGPVTKRLCISCPHLWLLM